MRRLLKFEFVLISILFVSNTAIANRKIMLVSGYKTLVHSAEQIVQVVSVTEQKSGIPKLVVISSIVEI